MPLRSKINPRLGTTGTTAVRLLSACSFKSSWRTSCKYTNRAASKAKHNRIRAVTTNKRVRKRLRSDSTSRNSIMDSLKGGVHSRRIHAKTFHSGRLASGSGACF